MSGVSKISFLSRSSNGYTSGERHRERPLLKKISSMTDDEIIKASVRNADKKVNDSKAARALKNGPLLFAATTSLVFGALAKGKLSNKAMEAVKTLAIAGVVCGLAKPTGKLTDAIFKSKEVDDTKKTNTFAKTAVSICTLAGASALLIKGATKGVNKLASIFEPTANVVKSKVSQISSAIDGSKLGKLTDKVSGHAQKFANAHPKAASALTATVLYAPLVGGLLGTAALDKKLSDKREQIAISNMNKLNLCREYASCAIDCEEALADD